MLLVAAFTFAPHLDCPEGGAFDIDVELLGGSDQDVPAIRLAP